MPSGNSVRPGKWTNVTDLYDNGWYSAIWGNYDGSPKKCLGVRWNGDSDQGYPNQGPYPLWYVEPEFTTKMILLELVNMINKNNNHGNLIHVLDALKNLN